MVEMRRMVHNPLFFAYCGAWSLASELFSCGHRKVGPEFDPSPARAKVTRKVENSRQISTIGEGEIYMGKNTVARGTRSLGLWSRKTRALERRNS